MPPSRTRIKICGIRDRASADAAVAAGADWLGFVFVERSPRFISPGDAARIIDTLPEGVRAVGLFCNHAAEDVLAIARAAGVHLVQLHGDEDPGFVKRLAGLRIIKALAFEAAHLGNRLDPWREAGASLEALLIDTPPDGPIAGGRGVSFDWEALARLDAEQTFHGLPPFYLAGGLTPGNVGRAVRTVRPYGVDVSSGVESSRGVKDPAMIAAFCQAVRQADADP